MSSSYYYILIFLHSMSVSGTYQHLHVLFHPSSSIHLYFPQISECALKNTQYIVINKSDRASCLIEFINARFLKILFFKCIYILMYPYWMLTTIKYVKYIFGEGNGNPLQYSCLENPRDRGAWWAAVYGVVQSWTWLKWLSSSTSKIYTINIT